ncbi:MAG: SRPBCC family protein [Candidatus Sericytochromatia bacterium]
MVRWYTLQTWSLAEALQAPSCFVYNTHIQASPEAVFRALSTSDWSQWFVDFKGMEWTSPALYQVGSTRTVTLKMLAVKERFLAWEPGQRFSFAIEAISLPVVEAMAEDWCLRSENGHTHVTWRVAYAPTPWMRLIHPLARWVFDRQFSVSLQNFKRYVESTAAQGL